MENSIEREDIATKALLLQQHQTLLRNQSLSRYFGRGALILIIGFMIAVDLSENWVRISIISTAALVCIAWSIEAWTIQRAIVRINIALARSEEGLHSHKWEDAHIEFDYFIYYRILFRLNRYFGLLEPLFWLYLVGVLLFLARRGGL